MSLPDDASVTAIADAGSAFIAEHEGRASIFVRELLGDLSTAVDAARRVDAAASTFDHLGAYVYLRVVLEVAIRLRWVAGDGPEPDLTTLRDRIESQRARDLDRLRSALEYLPPSPLRTKAIAVVQLELASVRAPKAPPVIEQMAKTEEARQMYGAHRLCSSLIHPGTGLRRVDAMDTEHAREMAAATLDYAVRIAATSAGILDRGGA